MTTDSGTRPASALSGQARLVRISAPSGDRDADRWQGQCPCGWKGAAHSNRTVEGRSLGERDVREHVCAPKCLGEAR